MCLARAADVGSRATSTGDHSFRDLLCAERDRNATHVRPRTSRQVSTRDRPHATPRATPRASCPARTRRQRERRRVAASRRRSDRCQRRGRSSCRRTGAAVPARRRRRPVSRRAPSLARGQRGGSRSDPAAPLEARGRVAVAARANDAPGAPYPRDRTATDAHDATGRRAPYVAVAHGRSPGDASRAAIRAPSEVRITTIRPGSFRDRARSSHGSSSVSSGVRACAIVTREPRRVVDRIAYTANALTASPMAREAAARPRRRRWARRERPMPPATANTTRTT